MAIGTIHRTGEVNPTSGVYQCLGCTGAGRGQREIPLSRSERFPPCSRCGAAVTWRLVRYA